MAESSSISSIIQLGSGLASTLEILNNATRFPKAHLQDASSEINSTLGALRQLQQFVEEHELQATGSSRGTTTPVLKDEGYRMILSKAAQCEALYRTIIAVLTKADTSKSRKNIKREEIDIAILKLKSNAREMKQRWLRPITKRLNEQLEFVKVNLFLLLQVFTLAKHQLSNTQRVAGGFEEELTIRYFVYSLRNQRRNHARKLARKYKKKPSPVSSAASSVINFRHDPRSGEVVIINEAPVSAPAPAPPPPPPPSTSAFREVEVVVCPKPPPYTAPTKLGPMQSFFAGSRSETTELKPIEPLEPAVKVSDEKNENLTDDVDVVKMAIEKTNKDVEFITMNSFQKQFGKTDSWFKELFGPSSLFFDDKPSEDLEAFMILGDRRRLKVPFGHRRLKFGMKKLMKAKKSSTLDEYYALPKHLHGVISNVLQGAKVSDGRERVVICFDVLSLGKQPEDQHLLLFVAANGPSLEHVHFKDCVGRKFEIPYHSILTWEEMKGMINQAFLKIDVIGPQVSLGHYDIIGPEGNIILPQFWEAAVKPGLSITMTMWPMNGPPPRPGFPRPPLPVAHPNGPPPPGVIALPPRPRIIRPSGVPPPPPPPNWFPRGRVLPPPRNNIRRRRSISSFTTYFSNSSEVPSDSEIENEESDLGIKFDWEKEKEDSKTNVKDLLIKWTNAIDVEGEELSSDFWSSTSDSGSDSSIESD